MTRNIFTILLLWFQHTTLADLPPITTKIIGGNTVFIDEAPFMASLQYRGTHVCGCSIISRRQVITAAHCTERFKAKDLSVRVGTTFRGRGGQVVKVRKFHQNRNFSDETVNFDVSVLDLKYPLTFGKNISRIPLAPEKQTFEPGTEADAFGWGTVSMTDAKQLARTLQRVSINIVDKAVCSKMYPGGLIKEQMLCAGASEGGKDACEGDSGGPLVVKGVLAGITSWGSECGEPDSPGVYANIAALRFYIDRFVTK